MKRASNRNTEATSLRQSSPKKTPGKLGPMFWIFWILPIGFLCIASALAIAAISRFLNAPGEGNDVQSLFLGLWASTLFGSFGGFVAWLFTALILDHRKTKNLAKAFPNQPWKWRTEWRKTAIRHNLLPGFLFEAGIALFWNYFVAGAAVAMILSAEDFAQSMMLVCFCMLFFGAGSWLVSKAIATGLQFYKWRTSSLQLSRFPINLGDAFFGKFTFNTARKLPFEREDFAMPREIFITLTCVVSKYHRPKNHIPGIGPVTSDDGFQFDRPLWQKTVVSRVRTKEDTRDISEAMFEFQTPLHGLGTPWFENGENERPIRWYVSVKAEGEFEAEFNLPIFDLGTENQSRRRLNAPTSQLNPKAINFEEPIFRPSVTSSPKTFQRLPTFKECLFLANAELIQDDPEQVRIRFRTPLSKLSRIGGYAIAILWLIASTAILFANWLFGIAFIGLGIAALKTTHRKSSRRLVLEATPKWLTVYRENKNLVPINEWIAASIKSLTPGLQPQPNETMSECIHIHLEQTPTPEVLIDDLPSRYISQVIAKKLLAVLSGGVTDKAASKRIKHDSGWSD